MPQCLDLRATAEKDLRRQLKLQSEAFRDHLEDEVKTREMEVERELLRKFDEKLEAERCKFKLQLAAIMGRLKGLDHAFKGNYEIVCVVCVIRLFVLCCYCCLEEERHFSGTGKTA